MAFQDGDFVDENLVEIPCEFCNDLFPMVILMEHQTACRPDLVRYVEPTIEELVQILDLEDNPTTENARKEDPSIERNWISIAEVPPTDVSKKKEPLLKISQSELEVSDVQNEPNQSLVYISLVFRIICIFGTSILEVLWFILKISFKLLMLFWNSESVSIEKFANDEEDPEAIEKALQESEAFTFGSLNKKKSAEEEEEKLSFKLPPNPILYSKYPKHIQNDLTESDNEENESLEEFWRRADIKLAQRLRMLQNKSSKLQ